MELDTPPGELDQASIAEKYNAQFEGAENLRAFAWTNRPRGNTLDGKAYRGIVFAIFARATLTYRAVIHLCRGGYTEQADMLTRSLFEDMAIALWVSLPDHHDEVAELLQHHHDFSRLLAADSLEKHADWLGPTPVDAKDREQLEECRDEFEKLFGRYGDRSWTGRSLWEMLNEIQHLWEDEEQRKKEFWGYYALGHRFNNQKLHSSAMSLNAAAKGLKRDDAETIVLRASPTDEESPIIRSLYGAMFTYGRIARLVVEETGADVAACDLYYRRQLDTIYKLKPSARGQIGRNDACPCSSGKKYKHCHGS